MKSKTYTINSKNFEHNFNIKIHCLWIGVSWTVFNKKKYNEIHKIFLFAIGLTRHLIEYKGSWGFHFAFDLLNLNYDYNKCPRVNLIFMYKKNYFKTKK